MTTRTAETVELFYLGDLRAGMCASLGRPRGGGCGRITEGDVRGSSRGMGRGASAGACSEHVERASAFSLASGPLEARFFRVSNAERGFDVRSGIAALRLGIQWGSTWGSVWGSLLWLRLAAPAISRPFASPPNELRALKPSFLACLPVGPPRGNIDLFPLHNSITGITPLDSDGPELEGTQRLRHE